MIDRARTIALYVHLPFCARKCPYCAFASSELKSHKQADEVLSLLMREAEVRRAMEPWSEFAVSSLFYGGGTPSTLTGAQIAELTAAMRDRFEILPEAEVTLEANPGTLTGEKIDGWLSAGIHRVSLGVQSLDDNTLTTLGRIHNAEQARKGFGRLREAGYENLNVDLMYGVAAEQPLEGWRRTLDEVVSWNPDHISAYGLIVEPGTEFAQREEQGEEMKPNEEIEREQYTWTRKTLAAAGYHHYEVSNWGKPGFESLHNRSYWDGYSYLSLGPAGHSYDHTTLRRFWNHRATGAWQNAVRETGVGEEGFEHLTERQHFDERLMLSLRMIDGATEEQLSRLADEANLPWPPAALEEVLERGLLVRDNGILRYTEEGLLIADEIEVILTA